MYIYKTNFYILLSRISIMTFEGYSVKIKNALESQKISVGDLIEIKKGSKTYTGMLMPRTQGDSNCIVIKLANGYNIGIDFRNASVRRIKPAKKSSEKKPALSFDKTKPPVALITTGGTITSKIDYETGAVRSLIKPGELLDTTPRLREIINLTEISSPFARMSEDMNADDWAKIAKETARLLNKGNKGVIITHGTDTLHYTAAALSFALKNLHKPVVLVGAQRSSDRGSADTTMNLVCSAYVAVSNISEVGICMHGSINDDYCLFSRGTKVRKMHTSRRDAFRPINELPLAKIWYDGKIEIVNKNYKKRNDSEKVEADAKFEKKVALLKAYPGSDPHVLEYYASKGYKGFVIEGTGLGHVPTKSKNSWIPVIKKLTKDGIPVVIAPQTLYGRINPNVYTNLRILFYDAGAIPGQDMLPETAYVKLCWALGHTKDFDKIKSIMMENIAGEITSRSIINTFLM